MDTQQLLQFMAAMQAQGADPGMLVKAAGNIHSAAKITQPGGMFAVAGMETDVISTQVTPRGIGAQLPVYESFVSDPYYGIFTGYGAETGSRPDYPCSDGPSGTMKAGVLTAPFGRIQHDTKTIEIDVVLDQKRGVNNNLRLLGDVFGQGVFGGKPANSLNPSQLLNLVVMAEMVGVGVQFERDLAKLTWQGDPANNTTNGGHKEFRGLDLLIKTGHQDAESSTAMAAADSVITDFAYEPVDSINTDIVNEMIYMEAYLHNLASRTGMMPVTWKIALREELWFELSAIWPCRYNTSRCSDFAGTEGSLVMFNDGSVTRQRDELRNTQRLPINGRTYEVVVDDGIYFDDNDSDAVNVPSGSQASSIYFIPTVVRNNFPSMYWEHKSYKGVPEQIAPLGPGIRNTEFWTDNGRYLWAYDATGGFCFKLKAKAEPRLLLRTPHLAGKIQNILYTPTRFYRSPFPGDANFVQGGVSTR